MKIAVLSSYTFDLIASKTSELLKQFQLDIDWYIAPFGQWRQEILNQDSGSSLFNPQIVFFFLDSTELTENPKESLSLLAKAAGRYPSSTILIANCLELFPQPLQSLEWNTDDSPRYKAAQFNCRLSELVSQLNNFHVFDWQRIVEQYGAERIIDPRFYYLAKMPISAFGLSKLSEHLVTALRILAGQRMKCIILDLDNTLWGGLIGEDGPERLKLSNDGEGKAWYDFQKHLLKLYNAGIILTICSKNDEPAAFEIIENHPCMLLRKQHFSAWRINWEDKARNICSIAEELNIGLDSCVFLDDSHHEREEIRALLPQVMVPDLPNDPSHFPTFLSRLPYFETFILTSEDSRRSRMYADERKRHELLHSSSSLEEFLTSLQIKAKIEYATTFNIARIAQLTRRTNQFNLTSRRYSDTEIASLARDPNWTVLSLSTSDRLGDSGLVGVSVLEWQDSSARLDTFLVSCRVLGRGLEQAFLNAVKRLTQARGKVALSAEYIPTGKNEIAKNFLSEHGFIKSSEGYIAHLQELTNAPEWIEVEII